MPTTPQTLALLALGLLVSACGVTLRAGRPAAMPDGALVVSETRSARCARSRAGGDAPFREALPDAVVDPELTPYLDRFDAQVRRTAVAAGVEPLLARLMRERERVHATPTPELLEMRQELAERVSSLPLQLLSVEYECECQMGLLDDVLAEHDASERSRELSLTLASLVAGAAFGLAASVWNLANDHTTSPAWHDGPLVTAITGAVVTTGLGMSVLVPRSHEIVVVHERNLLAPIAAGTDDEHLLPTFVFRILTLPMGDEPTPRETLLARWGEAWDDLVEPDRRAMGESIVYGAGGTYDPHLAELRRRLFDELESTLESLAPHVDALSQAIARALEEELTRSGVDDARDAAERAGSEP